MATKQPKISETSLVDGKVSQEVKDEVVESQDSDTARPSTRFIFSKDYEPQPLYTPWIPSNSRPERKIHAAIPTAMMSSFVTVSGIRFEPNSSNGTPVDSPPYVPSPEISTSSIMNRIKLEKSSQSRRPLFVFSERVNTSGALDNAQSISAEAALEDSSLAEVHFSPRIPAPQLKLVKVEASHAEDFLRPPSSPFGPASNPEQDSCSNFLDSSGLLAESNTGPSRRVPSALDSNSSTSGQSLPAQAPTPEESTASTGYAGHFPYAYAGAGGLFNEDNMSMSQLSPSTALAFAPLPMWSGQQVAPMPIFVPVPIQHSYADQEVSNSGQASTSAAGTLSIPPYLLHASPHNLSPGQPPTMAPALPFAVPWVHSTPSLFGENDPWTQAIDAIGKNQDKKKQRRKRKRNDDDRGDQGRSTSGQAVSPESDDVGLVCVFCARTFTLGNSLALHIKSHRDAAYRYMANVFIASSEAQAQEGQLVQESQPVQKAPPTQEVQLEPAGPSDTLEPPPKKRNRRGSRGKGRRSKGTAPRDDPPSTSTPPQEPLVAPVAVGTDSVKASTPFSNTYSAPITPLASPPHNGEASCSTIENSFWEEHYGTFHRRRTTTGGSSQWRAELFGPDF
ncbi:hypothetical protein EIP91_000041 [Steccherinum ochraceum]|uniref:C2H2-type domain-containing protein n=1 Tax=Steccherinum ochraceum TaxID=92696 RepID=A0A4R0RZI1_9APHY|nr:hypothetical protein EIP91_000041 [Steccherinum ochraceum]